jgi:hypothetical protein
MLVSRHAQVLSRRREAVVQRAAQRRGRTALDCTMDVSLMMRHRAVARAALW